jgi:hypothetical protein
MTGQSEYMAYKIVTNCGSKYIIYFINIRECLFKISCKWEDNLKSGLRGYRNIVGRCISRPLVRDQKVTVHAKGLCFSRTRCLLDSGLCS